MLAGKAMLCLQQVLLLLTAHRHKFGAGARVMRWGTLQDPANEGTGSMIAWYHSARAPCLTAAGSSAHRSSGASGEVGLPAAAVGEAVAGAPSFLCSTALVASLPSVSSSAAIMAAGLEVGCTVFGEEVRR